MVRLFRRLIWFCVRSLSRLRYRVRVHGLAALRDLRGPTLVMPNHAAYVDPPLVLSHVLLHDALRPLVFEGMYRRLLLYPFMRMISAFEVPDLEAQSRRARDETLAMIDAVAAGLQRGDSFLIYPAGRIQRGNSEVIGAARAAADLLQRCPQVNVVLVRTRGLWGSMFSFAQKRQRPNLGRCFLKGLGWLLANLFLFMPRREVTITIEVVPRDRLPDQSRETLNRFLEDWYNREGPAEPTYVPYHLVFDRRDFSFPEQASTTGIDLDSIAPTVRTEVNEMLEEHLGRPLEDAENDGETTLDEIGLDSLERMDLALRIEERFGFRSDRVATTIGELWALADGLLADDSGDVAEVPVAWTRSPRGPVEATVLGETIGEAFVRRLLTHPGDAAAADDLSGALTCRQMLVATTLMSRRFSRLDGDAVGVLLPASVAADLVFFGLTLANKLPVMLNWTTGQAHLMHAVRTMGIRRVITSRRFVDRLGIELDEAEYVFLEEVRKEIGKLAALRTLLRTYVAPGSFRRRLPRQNADQPAVVLFTSGSESAPKAVPLSHRNLLVNVRDGMSCMKATRADSLFGFLPPFHSFGLCGTVVLPLVTGLRVLHYPDPTDARGLVRTIQRFQPTVMGTTPTFLGYMFRVAGPEDLRSLRTIITGAEKCPDAVFERCAELAPAATIAEGYGITECSPFVSFNPIDNMKRGTIGLPMSAVTARVIHPETREPLPAGEAGLLLVRGESIFHGYLNYDGPDPFVELEGERWYNTGDLVAIDEDGYLHFRGRLKRFLKVGGEMVSLPALEETLARQFPPGDDGPRVAVEGDETPNGHQVVLFCTEEIVLREANAILEEAGFRGVMRLTDVQRIDQIPVLGTGKTDYKVLRRMVAESAGEAR